MLHLTLSDTILLVALVGVVPAYSYYAGLRIARGTMGSRSRAYGRTMLSWWLIASTMLFLWWRLGRPFARLGLVVPLDTRSVAGAAVCVLAIALITLQLRSAWRMPPERLSQPYTSFGPTLAVLPRTRAEYRLFLALSLTAGICEELLYRGYFLAIASTILTLAGAVVAGAILFGPVMPIKAGEGSQKLRWPDSFSASSTCQPGRSFGRLHCIRSSTLPAERSAIALFA